MISGKLLTGPLKLLILFLLLSGIPLMALGWLGWRLFEQDRALENQRLRDRLDNAANLATHELDLRLSSWDDVLRRAIRGDSIRQDLPPDSTLLVFDAHGVSRREGLLLPYYPIVPATSEAPADIFDSAEIQEFREQNFIKAAAAYRDLAVTKDKSIRAGALVRLARSLRNQKQLREAIAIYGELAALGDTPAAGGPSELLARRERMALLKSLGDEKDANLEAALLKTALFDGHLVIDHATFNFYLESVPRTLIRDDPGLKLAEVLEELWPLCQSQPVGRSGWTRGEHAYVTVWRRGPNGTAAIVGTLTSFMSAADTASGDSQVRLSLQGRAGEIVWGSVPGNSMEVVKTLGDTGLPWTMHVLAADHGRLRAAAAYRRNLLLAGFALMAAVIGAASYVVFRAVSQELRVARLQSDFVAAVSHEFRTPLTAMRHLTEMLEEDSVPSGRLLQYYSALGRETRRLHAMVESLLDFGRMDAGRRIYRLEDMSVLEIASGVIDEFRERAASDASRLELHASNSDLRIRVDRDALALAIRNLLDNAFKYSAATSTVSVSVDCCNGLAGISVQDQGVGIPKGEQRQVFRKFVRGASAKMLNVKGTGIGLTMADEIVKAHGGRLELVSEPGKGARFTILLPILQK
jgi:signal transduction histidine kinase